MSDIEDIEKTAQNVVDNAKEFFRGLMKKYWYLLSRGLHWIYPGDSDIYQQHGNTPHCNVDFQPIFGRCRCFNRNSFDSMDVTFSSASNCRLFWYNCRGILVENLIQ